MLANETFYSALIIAIFIFSDATPELNIKIGAGVALMSSLILLILSNIVMNVSQMYFGREVIKKTIRESKLKRAEKEALEEAEEQERRLKKKKEEALRYVSSAAKLVAPFIQKDIFQGYDYVI